jgi:hypothetical protein
MDNASDEVYEMQLKYGIEEQDKLVHLFERWAKVIDNARYLVFEHRFKEKEYGVKWRLAYIAQLDREVTMLKN